jgi:NADPH:quinone reductase-like Zn-dependent oxidoreductase
LLEENHVYEKGKVKMKAIVASKFGGPEVLQLMEVEKPAPKDNEILVKVRATTISAGDLRMRSLDVPPAFWLPARITLGFTKPKHPIYGMELAGDVVAVGKSVTRFKIGDAVFASTLVQNFGAHAEYKSLREDGMVLPKPHNMTYEEAAAVPIGGPTALRLLRKGKIQRGQKVVVYGASGCVGTYAVQIAKAFGADVTAVCSTENLGMVKALGADRVIDYTREDFSAGGAQFVAIFDAVGKCPKDKAEKALAPGGVYVSVAKLNTKQSLEELTTVRELIEAGKIRAVIDRCYPLEQVPEAHRYVGLGRKAGNVVIQVA